VRVLTRDDAVAALTEIAQDYIERHGVAPRTLITVGGTAISLRRLGRNQTNDIDLFHPDDAFHALVREYEERSGIRIDVTNRRNLWGSLTVRDIETDASVVESIDVGGFTVDLAAISPDTLFVIKACSMREKDRADLPLVLAATTVPDVMKRAETLLASLDRYERVESFLNLVAELHLVTQTMVGPSWFVKADALRKTFAPYVLEQFGVDLGGELTASTTHHTSAVPQY